MAKTVFACFSVRFRSIGLQHHLSVGRSVLHRNLSGAVKGWCGDLDSNQSHTDFQSVALPTMPKAPHTRKKGAGSSIPQVVLDE